MARSVTRPAELGAGVISPRHWLGTIAALVVPAVAWLLALAGLIGTVSILPALGWSRALPVIAFCVAPPLALWSTHRATQSLRIRAELPAPLLAQRHHGWLEAVTDSERRSLRPISATAYEVASRTSERLADLIAIPSVRIFSGVRPAGPDLPPIPHAVSAGRRLVFIESVAWPPGRYETAENGRIHCDGIYIGQSVRPLMAVVQHWRAALPKRHRVSAVIVVHAAVEPDVNLPAGRAGDVVWVHASEASRVIREQVLADRHAVSLRLVAALIAATADQR